jgi:3-oxoacyl-[acyl-carrier-protein] synthase III
MELHIRAVGTMLPGPPVDNATLVRRFAMPSVWEQWIDTFVGTRTRHFAVDLGTGVTRYSLTDMGAEASRQAVAGAGLNATDVDVVVMGTSSPDSLMPTTVNLIADRLGINSVPAYQLQSGCSGAVQAMKVACQMLATGEFTTALVIGGDTVAKQMDLAHVEQMADLTSAEQINGALFGDGAGAVVISARPGPGSVVLRHVFTRFVGLGRPPGQTVEWFGMGDRYSGRRTIVEDYKAIEESVPVMAENALRTVLDALDWTAADVDYLLPPQLSGTMTARILERLGAESANEISCVAETGNTGNALPFFQLNLLLSRMTDGDRAVGLAIESSKWIESGFAVESA